MGAGASSSQQLVGAAGTILDRESRKRAFAREFSCPRRIVAFYQSRFDHLSYGGVNGQYLTATSIDEKAPYVREHPFSERVLSIIPGTLHQEISADNFIRWALQFRANAELTPKLQLIFDILDSGRDGVLDERDLQVIFQKVFHAEHRFVEKLQVDEAVQVFLDGVEKKYGTRRLLVNTFIDIVTAMDDDWASIVTVQPGPV